MEITMNNFKYQDLAKVTILCTGVLLSKEALASNPLELEGENLLGPKSFVIVKPSKYDWEGKKPQGSIKREKVNSVDYFTKMHPELLDEACKQFSSMKKSFIIQKDIDGNPEFDDPRY